MPQSIIAKNNEPGPKKRFAQVMKPDCNRVTKKQKNERKY